jgi:hypothetical protein
MEAPEVSLWRGYAPIANHDGQINAYKAQRLSAKSERTDHPLTAAAISRLLTLLRHLLRLAHEEWEILVVSHGSG